MCVVFFFLKGCLPKNKNGHKLLILMSFLTCMAESVALNTKDDVQQNALLQHTMKLNGDHGCKGQMLSFFYFLGDSFWLSSSSLFISILFGCIFVWLAPYPSFLVRWLRWNRERGQREVPARPGTMKRFRRHGHDSQRDKHKQELYQFNKVIKLTSSVESLFCCYTYTSSIIFLIAVLYHFIYSLLSVVS